MGLNSSEKTFGPRREYSTPSRYLSLMQNNVLKENRDALDNGTVNLDRTEERLYKTLKSFQRMMSNSSQQEVFMKTLFEMNDYTTQDFQTASSFSTLS